MKIAICYSGAVRTLPETIKNNLDCFGGQDIDLYFSTWDHAGYADKINSPDHVLSNRLLPKNITITEEVVRNIIPSNANARKIKIEKYVPHNYTLELTNGLDNAGLGAQYYKVLDCFRLVDAPQDYDLLIRMRCDIRLNNYIAIEDLRQIVKDNKILFTSKIWYNHIWNKNSDSINEMMWICNPSLMRQACNIYENTDQINFIIAKRGLMHSNYGESICYMNLEAENITDNITTFDFDYQILR